MKKIEQLMNGAALDRALTRITHQILERNTDLSKFGVVGMQTRGVYLARRIIDKINSIEQTSLRAGVLDVTLYRDDYRSKLKQPKVQVTDIPFDINGIDMVLVDDVLFTGRTVRAALDALTDFGRPRGIQLAVLVDRGSEHREMPIKANYVGKKMNTIHNQEVMVRVGEIDSEEGVWLTEHTENG